MPRNRSALSEGAPPTALPMPSHIVNKYMNHIREENRTLTCEILLSSGRIVSNRGPSFGKRLNIAMFALSFCYVVCYDYNVTVCGAGRKQCNHTFII